MSKDIATRTRTSVAQGIALIKFNRAKTTVAAPMTAAQEHLVDVGNDLAYTTLDADLAWAEALKLCKSPADRKCLRAGFVPAYKGAKGCSEKSAQDRFDYMARLHSPKSSRKSAGHVPKAKPGPKEKTKGEGKHVPPADVALRLAAVLHYVAEAQAKHSGDSEIMELLGEIAAIAGGKTGKRK